MTQEERSKIAQQWAMVAAMHGKDLSTPLLRMMLDAVADLPASSVAKALSDWIRTSKQPRHPYPAEVRDIVNPKLDDRQVADGIARSIDRACLKHGRYWANGCMGPDGFYWEDAKKNRYGSFIEAAKADLGEVGLHAVMSRGGWEATAESSDSMEEGIFIAQMRDQVQASLALSRAGVELSQIVMPTPRGDFLTKISNSENHVLEIEIKDISSPNFNPKQS